MNALQTRLASEFRCPKCNGMGAQVRNVSMAGGLLSRIFNLQHNRFIAVSCHQCGFTEFYDARRLQGDSLGADIIDLLLGA